MNRPLSELKDAPLEELLELVKTDQRVGLKNLIKRKEREKEREANLIKEYNERNVYELPYYEKGLLVAGIDEVGRGPLAGPVVSAVCILDPKKRILGLKDSKKLTAKAREELVLEIKEKAIAYSIQEVSEAVIDSINILNATKKAMLQALQTINPKPDVLLIDALTLDTPIFQKAIIHGDDLSNSIAAASILAKVYRDELMDEYSTLYPEYGFEKNKGYGTSEHMEALYSIGPCPIHRKSFLHLTNLE
ncbi:ribonuclease HII [Guggenheimella bovis]